MFIPDYTLEVFVPDCGPGVTRYAALAHVTVDLGAVLPYLNAAWPGARYTPTRPSLSWRDHHHYITFWSNSIQITNLEQADHAAKAMQALIDQVNQIWEIRTTLQPDPRPFRPLPTVAVYQHLPHTNCRECGEPSCFSFAVRLALAQITLDACPPLATPVWAVQRAALQALLEAH